MGEGTTSAPVCHVSDSHHILAIEVSNPGSGEAPGTGGPGVALGRLLGRGVQELGAEPVRISGRGGHDDDLMPAIDRLFRRVGVTARGGTLDRVAVSVGPGGYTSVRVACAVGKMIAEAAGARCVAVPTASVVLEALPAEVRSGHVAVALAGKNDSAWVQVFLAAQEVEIGRLMTGADIEPMFAAGVRLLVADRFLPAPMRVAAERAGLTLRAPVFDAAACLRAGAGRPTCDPLELVPVYPREPDAVTLWRARKKS
jgi:tRNA A37 threonylcarbamoyladenosine modification protein TsaB